MKFVLSPLLYYMAHQADIEKFIILSTEGKHPYMLNKKDLSPLVEKYIFSHGIDEDKKVKYVEYICKKMMPSLW